MTDAWDTESSQSTLLVKTTHSQFACVVVCTDGHAVCKAGTAGDQGWPRSTRWDAAEEPGHALHPQSEWCVVSGLSIATLVHTAFYLLLSTNSTRLMWTFLLDIQAWSLFVWSQRSRLWYDKLPGMVPLLECLGWHDIFQRNWDSNRICGISEARHILSDAE